MPFTENRLQNCRRHRPEKGPRPARLHATSPKTGPGAVWGELIRKRANLDARRAPDRRLSAQNVTCHQGPKLGPSERGYMQITEFEPLSHHRKLPNLGLHRMRDTKRLFGGPGPMETSVPHVPFFHFPALSDPFVKGLPSRDKSGPGDGRDTW